MADPTDPDQTLADEVFAPPVPDWLPDTPTTEGVPTVDVTVTSLYNDPLAGKLRGVAVDQGSPVWLKFAYSAPRTGAPLTFSVGSYSTPPLVEVRYREACGLGGCMFVPDVGDEASLSADGTYVLLPVPIEVKNAPGVYRTQTRVRNGDGVEVARDEFITYVQRGFWLADGTTPDDRGPPTLQEVRTVLRDHPGANRLLGEYEFDAAEIGQAVVSTVQAYNSEFPTGGPNLNTVRWPAVWRRQLLDGVLAYLFETAAAYFRRGNLPYAAGGVSVDDLKKEQEYLNAAQMYRTRFAQWAQVEKARQSVAAAWGSQGSAAPYGGGGSW